MLNPNYHLFVGQCKYPTSGALSAAAVGDIVLYNPVSKLALNVAGAGVVATLMATTDGSYQGLMLGQRLPNTSRTVTGAEGPWRFSPCFMPKALQAKATKLTEGFVEGAIQAMYAAPVQRSVAITCNAGDNSAEMIFQLNIVYKDIRDLSPSVKYAPYYFVAPVNATAATVAAGLAKSVMDCKNRGQLVNVTVTSTGSTLTVTADDTLYDMGQRYEWTAINFDAVVSKTFHVGYGYNEFNSFLNNAKWISGGAVTTDTAISYGCGDYRMVADAEKRAQARMGVTNWTHFPVQMPRMYTVESADYNKYTADFKKSYRAADDTVDVKTAEQIIYFQQREGTPSADVAANIKAAFGA